MVELRELSLEDHRQLQFMFETRRDPQIVGHLLGAAPLSYDAHCEYLRTAHGKTRRFFFVVDSENDALVGYCQMSLDRLPQCSELGWVIHPKMQGRGYGKASVRLLIEEARKRHCANVDLYVKSSNEKAAQIYRESGFSEKSEKNGVLHMFMKLN